jgi:hypothetical protein
MQRWAVVVVFFVFAFGIPACSSSTSGSPPTPTCTAAGSALTPGAYGCDFTFSDDNDANICLAPLHLSAPAMLDDRGEQLTIDLWEKDGSAHRSAYIVIMGGGAKLATGTSAAFVDPSQAQGAAAVFTLSDPPTPDGMIEFEAKGGALQLTNVQTGDISFHGEGLRMTPLTDPLNGRPAKGSFTASINCHVQP